MVFRLRRGGPCAALALALTAGACGGGTQEAAAPAAASAPLVDSVDPATAGSSTGRIAFEGTAPPARAIKMASDPNCKPGPGGDTTEAVVVNGGALQNVFVYVKDGLGDKI